MDERILILGVHSDDETLGCGGLIAKKKRQGCFIHVVLVTVGDVYFYHCKRVVPGEERVREFEAAMGVLGVESTDVLYHGYESRLDMMPMADFISKVDRMLGEMDITDLYIPLPSSHPDHRYVYEGAFSAARPSPDNIKRVFAYENPAAVWSPYYVPFGGDKYADIKDFIDLKIEALRCHKTQIRDGGHLISPDTVRVFAQLRGREAGLRYAEKFKVLRMVE